MEKYIVTKDFFKLTEQKNYYVGDTIELSQEDAERLMRNGKVEKPKTAKAKK